MNGSDTSRPMHTHDRYKNHSHSHHVEYDGHPFWRHRPLTPAQLLVNDICPETRRIDGVSRLEISERSTASLIPESELASPSVDRERALGATDIPIEKQTLVSLEEDFGWMRHLRLDRSSAAIPETASGAPKCRWIHCAFRDPEYLRGFLWAFSKDAPESVDALHLLDHTMQHNTRFSKHGKYFNPFFQRLSSHTLADRITDQDFPFFMSIPFLDWTTLSEIPPLRFQVDKREGLASNRSSVHMLRSILQYFYRLEDTRDREQSQVFARHKPWTTDRELDLRVRQWYGPYPSGLNVDELWILAIDAEHIITLSSNQTWKSRWPPLQLPSRISDVSFRDIRNQFIGSSNEYKYNSAVHLIVCLSGAVGMMHRSFWSDMVLPLTDRYASHFSRLQYRLHRAPSTKLVMDLIACQEELSIVIQITQQQVDLIDELGKMFSTPYSTVASRATTLNSHAEIPGTSPFAPPLRRSTTRLFSGSSYSDPVVQILDNLKRELVDLQELRDSTDRLVTRTIQLVNIRLEDHGKAILVLTVITILFLPLNFVSSFFGMNVSDIRELEQTQSLFWLVALVVTASVVAASLFLAFSGGKLLEKFVLWRGERVAPRPVSQSPSDTLLDRILVGPSREPFQVHGVSRAGNAFGP